MGRTSVIIPAFNSEASIKIAIKSALQQTRSPAEIIVIDDGSVDGTSECIAAFGKKVKLIRQKNAGQGAARNVGLEEATGEYVAFLDSDDYWKPGFIEWTETFLLAHPEAVAVSCAFHVKRVKGDYFGPPHHEVLRRDHPQGIMIDRFFEFWAKHDHVRTGTVLIRRDAIEAVGGQNPDLRISQDLEYWALLATEGPWGILPEVLWVGTSDVVARKTGWRKKYQSRRRCTPDIDTWQARVLPRLKPDQRDAFARVRGRVAAGYMINHALGGDIQKARQLLKVYGSDMPEGHSRRILELGDRFGSLGWKIACELLQIYDRMK